MKTSIYLDNAATTALDSKALEAMMNIYQNFTANPSSMHSLGRAVSLQVEKSREIITNKIKAKSEELIFTSSGTEANNLALRGILRKGDHLITSVIEHPSVLEVAKQLEKEGIEVTYLTVDQYGFINIDQLQNSINSKTRLVSIQHANNEIGTIEPISIIANICREKNILFHTDACQSFGKIAIDLQKTPIDLMTISAHKIHGPIGIAGLYIRSGTKLHPFILGGGQELGLRSGTLNAPAIVGFSEAIKDINQDDLTNIKNIAQDFLKKIEIEFDNVKLNGAPYGENRLPTNINLSFKNVDGKTLFLKLSEHKIYISTGSACSSNKKTASPVLLALGKTEKDALQSIRISLSKWTAAKDMEMLFQHLKEIVPTLRSQA